MASFVPCPLLTKRPRPRTPFHPSLTTRTPPHHLSPKSSLPSNPNSTPPTPKISTSDLTTKVQRHINASTITPTSNSTPQKKTLLPIAVDLRCYQASRWYRRGDIGKAEEYYRELILRAEWDGRGHLGLAKILVRKGKYGEARGVMRGGLNVVDSRGRGYLLQYWGSLEEKWGNVERARGLLREACGEVERDDDGGGGKVNVACWVSLGCLEKVYGGVDGREKARECFERAVELNGENYYAWQCYGVLLVEEGEWEKARDCFRKGVEVNNRNAVTYVVWGKMENRLGNFEKAEELFVKAEQVNPRNVHAVVSRARLAEKSGNLKKAKALLRKAVRIRPYDPVVHQAKAMLEWRCGNWDAARKSFEYGVNIDRGHGALWNAWATMEATVGQYVRARQLFQEGIWADPKNKKTVWTWHAWALLEAKLDFPDVARKYFAKGFQADPTSVSLISSWAQFEATEKQFNRSRTLFEKALMLQPGAIRVWKQYETFENNAGNFKRAASIRERLLIAGQQKDRRLIVSDALAGDFASSGMWIDSVDLIRRKVTPSLKINRESKEGGNEARKRD